MFIIALKNQKQNGAFSIINEFDEKVLLFFQEWDDAERYRIMLEEDDYPEMEILEYEDDLILKTVQITGHHYTVITPHDLVVPPDAFKK
jgi:hypothetical protein